VLEENFWTSWCKGRLTEADKPTIRLGATPSRLNRCPSVIAETEEDLIKRLNEWKNNVENRGNRNESKYE